MGMSLASGWEEKCLETVGASVKTAMHRCTESIHFGLWRSANFYSALSSSEPRLAWSELGSVQLRHAALPPTGSSHSDPLPTTSAAGTTGVRAMGRIAVTCVPWPFDWICNVPPNWRKRSLIPRSPTPVLPDNLNKNSFSGGIPLPASSISTLKQASSCVMRIPAVGLPAWR